MKRHTSLRFKAAAAIGAMIAVWLVANTLSAYRYVRDRFARDEGLVQAVEEVSSLEHELRRQHIDSVDGLGQLLHEISEDSSDEIAWIRVLTANNEVEASSGAVEPHLIPETDRMRALMERSERYSIVQDSSRGELLIALVPIKQRLSQGLSSGETDPRSMVEIAIFLRKTEGILSPLGRNLLISTFAAILLLGSIVILLLRLPAYVRGRALESELQLARIVQQRLLPHTGGGDIEFAGECVPADQVGGDFYDVFRTDAGETVLALADVSGKGLPAALRLGVVHGAIRALAAGKVNSGLTCMAERLNELLKQGTSGQFVTLFLAFYNPARHELRYVNAGHPPPLLASRSGELRRLETGGPVLGILSTASYEEECIRLDDDDEALIACSDRLLEATSPAGEEFGESHLIPIVRTSPGQSAQDVLSGVMENARRFIDGGEFHDDLTVLVAKLVRQPAGGTRKLDRMLDRTLDRMDERRLDGAPRPTMAA
jgi:hypothetical protein